MLKSMSLSSDGSLDDADSVSSDELLGSQSRRWLNDLMTRDMTVEDGHVNTIGVDGLFVDHHFPRGELEMQSGVEWKRPKELCTSPQFIVDGASRLDVRQGDLNDCWLLSAISSLSLHHFLLQKVMPPGQGFQEGYNGCFTFRFWQYGQWEEVRIDDLLPTRHNKLIYLSSPERHEFWSSLLEKAYAKMKGGYRALDMGYPHEAMVDMTGGVTEVYSVGTKRNLSSFLRQQLAKGALINCANCQGTLEKKSELGIMFKHAYSLTAIEKLSYPHRAALPSLATTRHLFKKHCNKKGQCKPAHLHSLLTEALQEGVLAGSEKYLALEHCKSLVVLMDNTGNARLNWDEFQSLWDKIRRWTDIFLVFDKNKTNHLEYKEVEPALNAAGIVVDELVMQLVGLRYTELDMTISYPGFLYLLMKLESMIQVFQAYDMAGMGRITLDYKQWLHMTMYN